MNIASFGTSVSASVDVSVAASDFAPVQQNRALSQAVRVVNDSSSNSQDRQLSITLDPVTKIAVAQVVNPTTGEILNQVPSEDILRLAAYLEAQNAEEQAAQESTA